MPPAARPQDYDQRMLEVGYEDGSERLLLWLPVICKHVITEESPLASWLRPSGIMADADASIVVVVRCLAVAAANTNPACLVLRSGAGLMSRELHLQCNLGRAGPTPVRSRRTLVSCSACCAPKRCWSNTLQPQAACAVAVGCILEVLHNSGAACRQVEGYMYSNAQNRMRMRIFNVLDDVKREAGFAPVVTRPADSPDFKPRVNWSRFHETMPLAEMASDPGARALGRPGLTHSDGVNGPADITGGVCGRLSWECTSSCCACFATALLIRGDDGALHALHACTQGGNPLHARWPCTSLRLHNYTL